MNGGSTYNPRALTLNPGPKGGWQMVSIKGTPRKLPLLIYPLVLLVACTLIPHSGDAQSLVRPVNLIYLSRRAEVIVQGRVVSVKYEPMPGYEHIPTVRVTLEVAQVLRGPQVKEYAFRQLVSPLHPREGKHGAYQPGQELLLFMLMPSQYGLSSPIGLGQGTFHVQRDAKGRRFIANDFGNGGLFKDVRAGAADQGLILPKAQLEATTRNGPVELDKFKSLVKSLITLPRIE
jgi:hypothetical protein